MSTYVLVHGAWHGSWCWDKVVSLHIPACWFNRRFGQMAEEHLGNHQGVTDDWF